MRYTVRFCITVCFLAFSAAASAQILGKVGSLLAADRTAARLSEAKGPYTALQSIIDQNSLFFTPQPVVAAEYLSNRPNIPDVMTWKPTFAAVAKSMEWGVTTGSLSFQRVGAIKRYGEYLTVWHRDRKGNWKVNLRAQIEHKGGGKEEAELSYIEPDDTDYTRFKTKERIEQRKEIVHSNDQLLSAVLKSDASIAYREFLADNARFYFPWHTPIVGKEQIMSFVKKQEMVIQSESLVASRSYSGELAYSYGTATVVKEAEQLKCNYVRIWQLQDDFQWRVIVEMYFEA